MHALESVRKILRPGGLLINVHDLPLSHVIEAESDQRFTKVGWLLDKEDYIAERSAFNALTQAVERGLFVLDDEEEFKFNIHLDGLHELEDLLADNWQSSMIPERTLLRIKEFGKSAPAKIVLHVPTRMTKLIAA